jgi:hypothetical protein
LHGFDLPVHSDSRAIVRQAKGGAGPLAGKTYNKRFGRLMAATCPTTKILRMSLTTKTMTNSETKTREESD